jgi:hypothetical protein
MPTKYKVFSVFSLLLFEGTFTFVFISVADPDPPDPHVFGPPGSGSFYQHAKIKIKP